MPRISTRVVTDIGTGEVEARDCFEYSGLIEQAKGADTANQQRQQELDMQQAAFNQQQQQLTALNAAFGKYLSGTIGFSPQAMTAMRSSFLNSNNSTFNQAGQQVREALGARGEGTGQNPVGGSYVNGISSLMAAKAGSQSQGLLGLDVTNQQQALTNQFNAGSLLSGNAATLTGTQGVAGNAASSALNSYINAANQGFGASLLKGFGSALGGGLGAGLVGGIGGGLSSFGSFGSGFNNAVKG